ncbi:T9SS type A sorting domain-containing protein [Ferruginibacter sp.]
MRKPTIALICLLFFYCRAQAQSCTPLGDQVSYGTNNVWIGYAYDNPDFTNYSGYVNEGNTGSPNFDESFGGDDVTYNTNGCGIFTSTFSMRYKLTKTFTSGYYLFTVGGDDGFRLSIDGGSTWIIDQWADQSYTTRTYLGLLNGTYNMVLEYYENQGGNRVSFDVSAACVGTENTALYGSNNIWNGYIYDGTNFNLYQGMVTEGSTGSLNFDESFGGSNVWYPTSACNVQTETFSARYRLTKTFTNGNYLFTVGGDDGYRLSIDGGATWLVDRWYDQSYNTTMSPVVTLSGTYNLVLEFYENGGDNRISITAQLLNILAVDVTSFTATLNNNDVELNWAVAAGSNPQQFAAERSSNGTNFNTIFTTAAGNTLQYNASDKNVPTGTWYYRLKITDRNGHITYSNITAVHVRTGQGSSEYLFYPTITNSNYVLFKSGADISNAHITVLDVNGRIVAQQSLAKISAAVPTRIQLTQNSKLPAGFYIIKINGGDGEVVTGKVVVQ